MRLLIGTRRKRSWKLGKFVHLPCALRHGLPVMSCFSIRFEAVSKMAAQLSPRSCVSRVPIHAWHPFFPLCQLIAFVLTTARGRGGGTSPHSGRRMRYFVECVPHHVWTPTIPIKSLMHQGFPLYRRLVYHGLLIILDAAPDVKSIIFYREDQTKPKTENPIKTDS